MKSKNRSKSNGNPMGIFAERSNNLIFGHGGVGLFLFILIRFIPHPLGTNSLLFSGKGPG